MQLTLGYDYPGTANADLRAEHGDPDTARTTHRVSLFDDHRLLDCDSSSLDLDRCFFGLPEMAERVGLGLERRDQHRACAPTMSCFKLGRYAARSSEGGFHNFCLYLERVPGERQGGSHRRVNGTPPVWSGTDLGLQRASSSTPASDTRAASRWGPGTGRRGKRRSSSRRLQ